MWLGKRRALTDNLVALLESVHSTTDKLVTWMRTDAALVRYALRNRGDQELTVPNDDLRLLLAEQPAAVLMAKENLLSFKKRRLFSIKQIRVPIYPEDFKECIARIWVHMWPDCRYPRYAHLTPEQCYFCFGPDGKSRFGPEAR